MTAASLLAAGYQMSGQIPQPTASTMPILGRGRDTAVPPASPPELLDFRDGRERRRLLSAP
jgi:hypothetical protein